MKKLFLLLALICLNFVVFSQDKNTVSHSSISFKIKNLGINTGGTFGGLSSEILFKPTDLAASSINATVETNTINTDNESRDEHLKSEDYFDVARFPKISLKSVSFKHKGGNNYSGAFNLEIRGKIKLIELPFTYIDNGTTESFKGSFKLNRLDFGVGGSSLILSDEVTVSVEVEKNK